MTRNSGGGIPCPVVPYEQAGADYAESVCAWLENPHAAFRAFGPEARAFQRRNPSPRLRTMTLVAPAAELVALRPVCLCLDGVTERVGSWEEAFSLVTARLVVAHPQTFAALQAAGELAWIGCPADGTAVAETLEAGLLKPEFQGMDEVVGRVQWLFLMCGIRLNEVIVQVDPYTDDQWIVRRENLRRKRAEEQKFMEGRRAAQRAWAESHPPIGT